MKKHLVVALLFATPALAALPPLSASLGYASEVFTSREYDLVDGDDHLPMWHVGAAYSLVPARGLLDVELAYHSGVTDASAFQAVTSQLWLRGVKAGATWRYPLYAHLEPYAHLGGGADWVTLTIGGEGRLQQTLLRPGANALVGVQVPLPLRGLSPSGDRQSALVLDFGVGYSLRPGFSFHDMEPKPPQKAPEDPIERAPTNLGAFPLSGVSYRITLAFRL